MIKLTGNQLIHRAYLCSPVWKTKREQALDYYGCICNRCKEYGNDVHHKTYVRVGGDELVEDLEVLCRDCHEVHHEIDRMIRVNPNNPSERSIHRQAIYNKLTENHLVLIWNKFPDIKSKNLRDVINFGNPDIAEYAASLIGCCHVFGIKRHINFGKRQKPLYSTKELKDIRKRDKYLIIFRK